MRSTHAATAAIDESEQATKRRVLIVDDDEALSGVFATALGATGYVARCAPDGREAARVLERESFDVIVTDVSMPGMSGVELLQVIRKHDLDVPVVLITGAPDVASAARAVEYGAFRYLEKPVSPKQLREVVDRAAQFHELQRIKRQAMALLRDHAAAASDLAGLEAAFTESLGNLFMHFQPIVQTSTRSVFAYEALVRSSNAALPNPGALLDAAKRLGRISELGRSVRTRVAGILPSVGSDQIIFVNVHPLELLDDELLSPEAPLSAHASRVVLEVTERASLENVSELDDRVSGLRALGYRLALDDFGEGYASAASFVRLKPEFVKIDMTLTRDLHRSETKRLVMRKFLDLFREMSIPTIVEGVETTDELRALSGVGADLLQGYLFGRPEDSLRAVDSTSFVV